MTGLIPEDAGRRSYESLNRKKDPLKVPNVINPNISDDVTKAIMKGLAMSPRYRSQTVQDWINLLSNLSSDVSVKNTYVSRQNPIIPRKAQPTIKQNIPSKTPVVHIHNPNYRNDGIIPGLSVRKLALTPDNKELITSGDSANDGSIKIWNMETGELLRTLKGHSQYPHSLTISKDGKIIVSGSMDKTIKVWNLQTGKLLRTLKHSSSVSSVAISNDGQTIVTGAYDKTIKVWNVETGELLRTLKGHSDTVMSVAMSKDGKTIVSGSWSKTIKVWNLQTGKLLRTLKSHSRIYHVAISNNGQTIVSNSGDNIIQVWNLDTGELLRTLNGHSEFIHGLAISKDGQIIVSGGSDNTIKVWNLATENLLDKVWNWATGNLWRTIKGHSDRVIRVAISDDGQTIVSGSWDKTIKVWNLET